MEMKAGDEEDRSNLVHAAPPYTAVDDDVMVDLSCFDGGGGGGGYDVAAAAMEEADHQDLMDNAAAIFCDDLIPPLPDFQCMSSSSSSSSSSAVKPVAYRSTASSSNSSSVSASSSTSWAVLRSDGEENRPASVHHHHETPPQTAAAALSSTASVELNQNNRLDEDYNDDIGCMDVMETLGYMDLLDENGHVWDYSDSPLFDFTENKDQNCTQAEAFQYNQETENNQSQPPAAATENENNKSEDLALVFLEWLKSNKESISAEDLRSIKLKKSTIENAAKRLGNGKEGMKRLLQLILEWVQHHQLQRKRRREEEEEAAAAATLKPQIENQRYPVQYPAQPYQNLDANLSITNSIAQPNQMQYAGFDPMMANGYIGAGDPSYGNNGLATTWAAAAAPAPYCMNYNNNTQNLVPVTQQQQQPYAFDPSFNQYPYQYYPAVVNGNNVNGVSNEGLLARTGSSATKEARKKRMARQRRFLGHHRHHHHNSISNGHHRSINGHPNQISMPVETSPFGRGNAYENCGQPGVPNWAYWQNVAPPPPVPLATNAGKSVQGNEVGCSPLQQSQNYQRPIAPERRQIEKIGLSCSSSFFGRSQGPKPEKNLRFLLQKVLKQSDVGSLGRIVLPKKEAEIHLPQLNARDGINIAMEDIGTMHVWNMRYRFWPNNKSRMYLLENTGEFVKSNGLQEGDFIVIYSDIKCGKYMIRGVKVRQQDPKSDPRRSGKAQKKNINSTSISSPATASPNNTPRKETLPSANMDHQQMYN
ncbi:unnamed protein product [Rhodiola kirilowii]